MAQAWPLFCASVLPSASSLDYWFQAGVRWFAKWPCLSYLLHTTGVRRTNRYKVCLASEPQKEAYIAVMCLSDELFQSLFLLSWLHKVNTLIYKASRGFSLRDTFGSQDIATKGHSTLWRYCMYCGVRGIHFSSLFVCCSSVSGPSARGQKKNEVELGNQCDLIKKMLIMHFLHASLIQFQMYSYLILRSILQVRPVFLSPF